MSLSFTKLFSSITDSSIWCEDSDTKVVWVTMLAMADEFGRVMASIPGLAKRANVPIEKTEIAISKFLSADPYSRTKDHEGKRIEVYEGGWRLLNHQFYRDIRHDEDRKEQNRQAQQRRRERLKCQQNVSNGQQMSAQSAQADADAKPESKNKEPKPLLIPEALNTPKFLTVWNEWTAHRRKLKACKNWEMLFKKQLEQLAEWGEAKAIQSLNNSMMNDYQGIFEPKNVGPSPSKPFIRRPSADDIIASQSPKQEPFA